MIRLILFSAILIQISYSTTFVDVETFDIWKDHEIPFGTTENPFINIQTNKTESYCKGWCRTWEQSKRRYRYKKHIACTNSNDFAYRCINPGEIVMFPDRINHILHRHNKIRDTVASGQLAPKFPEAWAMNLLKWDNELAYLASLNAKTCHFEVDFCFDKYNFEHFGQNIAIWDTSYGPVNYTLMIDEMIQHWQKDTKYLRIL